MVVVGLEAVAGLGSCGGLNLLIIPDANSGLAVAGKFVLTRDFGICENAKAWILLNNVSAAMFGCDGMLLLGTAANRLNAP